ncbi:recombinase family protein [Bacteroides ndongoniae]|uniref:recombinase family protein n=1 Tax=Bacteroides ndongoniae TaxID=1903262 RepID=UPI0008DA248E|nr:recombinase family protein [Bacteroides ndongoniae]
MKAKVNNQTNVIIYCRVSTDEQRKGTSVEVQEERLRGYCKYKGYNIIELPNFKEDESAKTFKKRPVMRSILRSCFDFIR